MDVTARHIMHQFQLFLFLKINTLKKRKKEKKRKKSLILNMYVLHVYMCLTSYLHFSCKQFWLVAAIYALSNGMLSGFGSVLDVNMASAHVPRDQLVTGWMSLGSLVASIVYCIIISR